MREYLYSVGSLESFDCEIMLYRESGKSGVEVHGGGEDDRIYVTNAARQHLNDIWSDSREELTIEIRMIKTPAVWTVKARLNALYELYQKRGCGM
ncbi:hypothetical protein D3C76_63260 [compost metagenome]